MPLFDRLKGEMDRASFEANKMMRINAVQSEINGLKKQLQGSLEKLGATTFDLFKAQRLAEPELVEMCKTMVTAEVAIAAKEKEIESIRQETAPAPALAAAAAPAPAAGKVYGHICPKEQIQLPDNVVFCPTCGTRAIDVPPPLAPASAAPTAQAVCANCHSPLLPNAAFCPNCGTRVSAA